MWSVSIATWISTCSDLNALALNLLTPLFYVIYLLFFLWLVLFIVFLPIQIHLFSQEKKIVHLILWKEKRRKIDGFGDVSRSDSGNISAAGWGLPQIRPRSISLIFTFAWIKLKNDDFVYMIWILYNNFDDVLELFNTISVP